MRGRRTETDRVQNITMLYLTMGLKPRSSRSKLAINTCHIRIHSVTAAVAVAVAVAVSATVSVTVSVTVILARASGDDTFTLVLWFFSMV